MPAQAVDIGGQVGQLLGPRQHPVGAHGEGVRLILQLIIRNAGQDHFFDPLDAAVTVKPLVVGQAGPARSAAAAGLVAVYAVMGPGEGCFPA